MSLKYTADLLKGLWNPWLVWVRIKLVDFEKGKITPEESFMNAYADEVYESEQFHTSTRQLRVILDAKYEKAYLNKVM